MAKTKNGNGGGGGGGGLLASGTGSGTGTSLAVITPEQFPVAATAQVVETIRQNLGGELPSPDDFNRIKVPAGGGTTWEIPTVDGEPESARYIDGVIVHVTNRRARWASAENTGDPPICASKDCIRGVGDPGGLCEPCPYNQFGTALRRDGTYGEGKGCGEKKLVFILRANQMLPDIVQIPGGSLRSIFTYQFRVGFPLWSVVTRLSLVKEQKALKSRDRDGNVIQGGTVEFAKVKAARLGILETEMAQGILAYARGLQQIFEVADVAPDGVEEVAG